MDAPARLIGAGQLAELLGMSEWWVLAEARAGRLPHFKLGRAVRFDPQEVDAWLDEHHQHATAMDPEEAWAGAGRSRARVAEPPQQLAAPRRRRQRP